MKKWLKVLLIVALLGFWSYVGLHLDFREKHHETYTYWQCKKNAKKGFNSICTQLPEAVRGAFPILLKDGRVLFIKYDKSNGSIVAIYEPSVYRFKIINSPEFISVKLLSRKEILINSKYIASFDEHFIGSIFLPNVIPHLPLGYNYRATLLSDKELLITGVSEKISSLCIERKKPGMAIAGIYNIPYGLFYKIKEMNFPRSSYDSTFLRNNSLLITGGECFGRSAELYLPEKRAFIILPSMHAARVGHQVTSLLNGDALITGGQNVNTAEIYRSQQRKFFVINSTLPITYGHQSVLLGNGDVLIVGGISAQPENRTSANNQTSSAAVVFDPEKKNFYNVGHLYDARAGFSAKYLTNGQVLIIGGYKITNWSDQVSVNSVETYLPN